MAAYECGSTDFPTPPYPDSILCPDAVEGENVTKAAITMWDILSKVHLILLTFLFASPKFNSQDLIIQSYPRLSGLDHFWFDHKFHFTNIF